MIETLLGGLLGGAFRLAPEVLKWLDRKASAATSWRCRTRRWSSRSYPQLAQVALSRHDGETTLPATHRPLAAQYAIDG